MPVCINANYVHSLFQEEAWQKHYLENGPVALTLHSNVSVSVGGTVQLPCRIKNLGEYTVIKTFFQVRGILRCSLIANHHIHDKNQHSQLNYRRNIA